MEHEDVFLKSSRRIASASVPLSASQVAKLIINKVFLQHYFPVVSWSDGAYPPFDLVSVSNASTLIEGVLFHLKNSSPASALHVTKPCAKVFGDIHGQFFSLLQLFDAYGRPTDDLPAWNWIFLGDYVDRGHYSIECLLLLFSLKLRHPESVVLLRGNHEVRGMNMSTETGGYGFQDEMMAKFGVQKGMALWQRINDVFDWLPVAALIEEADVGRCMLCHGGLGPSLKHCSQLADLSLPIVSSLETERDATWNVELVRDVLWSDPAARACDGSGFFGNENRGDGIFTASYDEIESFCVRSCVDVIIRGHEVCMNGFELSVDGRVVTLFSACNYTGSLGNSGALLCVTSKRCGDGKRKLVIYPKVVKHVHDQDMQQLCVQDHDRLRDSSGSVSVTEAPKPRLRVMWDFEATFKTELSVLAGDVVQLLDDSDPEWAYVCLLRNQCRGYVPLNYLHPLFESTAPE